MLQSSRRLIAGGSASLRQAASRYGPQTIVVSSSLTPSEDPPHRRSWLSTAASPKPEKVRLPIPPNLTFDPRSSFAPKAVQKKKQIPFPGQRKQGHRAAKKPRQASAAAEAAAADTSSTMEGEEQQDEQDYEYDEEEEEEEEEDGLLYIPEKAVNYAIPLPERLTVEVHTLFAPLHSSLTGTLTLDESVFGKDPIRIDLLKRAVDYIRACKRGRRKAKTKTVSEVAGSGRKVRQQKGTGMARAGHRRPAHWRGGAKAHGPKNTTDYSNTKLNQKVRRLAMRHCLSQKLKEGNLLLLNSMHELPTHKTRELEKLLEPWGFGVDGGTRALLLDHYHPEEYSDSEPKPEATSFFGVPVNLHVASANLFRLTAANTHAANVYNILLHEKLVLTVAALQVLEERLKE